MAEGWAGHLKSESVEPYSAGLRAEGLNPYAVRVMAEAGVDIGRQRSKKIEEVMSEHFDYVVTVCDSAQESCPVFPRAIKVVHAGFDDPPRLASESKSEEEVLSHYRRVRDQIKEFVLTLPESLQKEGC